MQEQRLSGAGKTPRYISLLQYLEMLDRRLDDELDCGA
jgi:hypothetical protein